MQLQRLERIYYQYFDGFSGENCALIFTFCLFVEKYRRSSSSRSPVVVVACLGHRTVEEELVVAAPRTKRRYYLRSPHIYFYYVHIIINYWYRLFRLPLVAALWNLHHKPLALAVASCLFLFLNKHHYWLLRREAAPTLVFKD